jgi:hypothetical protein
VPVTPRSDSVIDVTSTLSRARDSDDATMLLRQCTLHHRDLWGRSLDVTSGLGVTSGSWLYERGSESGTGALR